jgi:RNA polymerase sigma-70 factor (ECF subfamily)
MRNISDAEDVVQETFLKLYRTGAWRNMKDERAFLAKAAWRSAIDQLPARRNDDADFEAASRELASEALDPEQETIEADWNRRVHRLIDALPEELRRPLALSTVNELNSPEIAKIMDIPEGTVRTRLMKARQMLKQKISAMRDGCYAR